MNERPCRRATRIAALVTKPSAYNLVEECKEYERRTKPERIDINSRSEMRL
jgi:hypothetical protein